MERIKQSAAVVLSAILLVCTAFLPWAVAHLQEQQQAQVQYAPISEVTLDIHNITLWDTLALASSGEFEEYELSDVNGVHSREEVQAIGAETIALYQNAGLITRQISGTPEILAMVIYPTDAPNNNHIIWGLQYMGSEVQEYDGTADQLTLDLLIDDSSGKVLGVAYYDSSGPFRGYNLYDIVQSLYAMYFDQLGEPFAGMAPSCMTETFYSPDKHYANAIFYGTDPDKGDICMQFHANMYGFNCNPAI